MLWGNLYATPTAFDTYPWGWSARDFCGNEDTKKRYSVFGSQSSVVITITDFNWFCVCQFIGKCSNKVFKNPFANKKKNMMKY